MDLLARVLLTLGLLYGSLWCALSGVAMLHAPLRIFAPLGALLMLGLAGFLFMHFFRQLNRITRAD